MNLNELIEKFSRISPQLLCHLDNRLQEWANWHLKKDNPRLGYPHETIEYHLMTVGIFSRDHVGLRVLPSHDRAEEMEVIIRIMAMQGEQNMLYATALREYYLGRGRGSQSEVAKRMGVSIDMARRYLKGATIWLMGWFSGYFRGHFISGK